jgi:hypothetical protein
VLISSFEGKLKSIAVYLHDFRINCRFIFRLSSYCIYLPPLRDAEEKLTDGRQSRLSKLLKALSKKELLESQDKKEPHPLEKRVAEFNEERSGGESHWKDWFKDPTNEAARLAYVACSRPKHLLILAIKKVTPDEKIALDKKGFCFKALI